MPIIRLRTWLVMLLFTAVSLTFVIVGSAILYFRLPQVEARAIDQLHYRSMEAQRLLDLFLDSAEAQIRPLAIRLGHQSPPSLQGHLDAILASSDSFDALLISSPDGTIQAVGTPTAMQQQGQDLIGADLSNNPLFREASALGETGRLTVWSDKYLSPLTGKATVGVALPTENWVIIGELSLERLLSMLKEAVRREDAFTAFIDGRAQWLASTNPTPNPTGRHFDYGNLPLYRNTLLNGADTGRIHLFGHDIYASAIKSERLKWVIVSVTPAGWAHYSYRVTILLVAGGFVGSLLMSLLLAPVWANGIARPLRRLFDRVSLATTGDYITPWPCDGHIQELNRLGHDLETMSVVIRTREAAIARSEARLRATLETTPMVAIQWYDGCGRVLYWNRASEVMYGFTAEEAVGVALTEQPLMYHDREQARAFVAMLAGMAAGQPAEPAEFSLRRKDGREIIVLAATFAIPGEDAQPIFVCMDIDLTERKQAEAALKASEIKLEAIFNASPAPMSVSDADNQYRCIAVNAAWEQQFQRPQHTVVGKNGLEMNLWEAAAQRNQFLAVLQRDGIVSGMEAWLINGQGQQLLCAISALTVMIGADRLVLMMAEDITERRRIEDEIRSLNVHLEERVAHRTEQLSQANEELEATINNLKTTQQQLVQSEKLAALGNLVAGVAHELNTPIGNGLMSVSTLRERLGEFQKAAAAGLKRSMLDQFIESVETGSEIAMRNLQRAADLITSFKQVAIDQTSSQRRSFSVKEILDEILLSLHPTLKRTPYKFDLHVNEAIVIDSYPGPLGQVFINLINNAILHGFDGRDHGRVLIEVKPWGHGQVEIRFSDNGKGIPPEQIKRVFDPFFTTRMGRGGSGLGLHVTYNIVTTMLGGMIEVHSQVGEGTAFTLRLPIQAPVAAE